MSMRRFTRLTNGFSKKVENHAHAIALHYMFYNLCRIHKLCAASQQWRRGVTSKLWEIEDIVALLPKSESKPRGPYKKCG